MEILNQNQRRSAIWRLAGLGILVVAINAVVLISAHKKYANAGCAELEELQSDWMEKEKKYLIKIQDLENSNNLLNNEIVQLKRQMDDPDQRVQALQNRLQLREDRVGDLESDLDRCKDELGRCQTQLDASRSNSSSSPGTT